MNIVAPVYDSNFLPNPSHGGHIQNLSDCGGGYNTRFFNTLSCDEFTVTKSSSDIRKMKAEYTFFHLLPDYMKAWCVMPYDYKEVDDRAGYTMKRYHIPDMGIRFAHGAIDIQEYTRFLKTMFRFIQTRAVKDVDIGQYKMIQNALYLEKVISRIAMLKWNPLFEKIDKTVSYGTHYSSINTVVDKYRQLYGKYAAIAEKPQLVIGHGDPCFSNILYDTEADSLKLIDPRGALSEDELWTDPYYDIVKLSSSVCGRYDLINHNTHTLSLNNNLQLVLHIDFDNTAYMRLFRDFCTESGFDYFLVRLLEVSLFLSYLPLHIDNPRKVFGFILNAINLLDELEGLCGNSPPGGEDDG